MTPAMVLGQMHVQSKQSIGQNRLNENPLLSDYDVKFYGLDVEVNDRSASINGSVTIVVEVTGNDGNGGRCLGRCCIWTGVIMSGYHYVLGSAKCCYW